MLFNSYVFIFCFLPVALVGFQVASRFNRKTVVLWLAFASLVFYGYWRPSLLYVLLLSVGLNYVAGALITKQIRNEVDGRIWVTAAVTINLLILGYFKYLFPSLNFLSDEIGSHSRWPDIALPLGISFFTFTQIAFLIDLYQGIAKQQTGSSYLLFVTFFPHLIAGPILHHKDMMPQFDQDRKSGLRLDDVCIGFSWFILGLCKKVVLADQLAKAANPVFDSQMPLTSADAWQGCLAYCLQLYFDFSGYSDMALGLARMFSINFPLNFNSPFKSASIIEFWQRWHITLSNYIMSYLFTPLQLAARQRRTALGKGVSRKDIKNPAAFMALIGRPMLITLFIAGVWHGAGLQFVVYGLLHGTYLTINHGWRIWGHPPGVRAPQTEAAKRLIHVISVLGTFLCVMVSFVFFRSHGVRHALRMLYALSGLNGVHQDGLSLITGPIIGVMAVGFVIVWCMPNTQQILTSFKPSLNQESWNVGDAVGGPIKIRWAPSRTWAILLGCLFFFVLSQMEDPSTFLYFQF